MDENQRQSAEALQAAAASPDALEGIAAHPVAADFDEATRPGDLWPEAADACCSEHAALFAGTQPAPLSVV